MRKKIYGTIWALNIVIILCFWWYNSGSMMFTSLSGTIIALGRLTGLMAAFFVLMQFMLIGRAVWLEQAFGLDNLTRVHHLNGRNSIYFILLHPILITIGYALASKTNVIQQFLSFLTSYEDVLKAFLAALLFITIVGLSLYIVRKHLKYETWYYVHLLTYLAVILAWGHQLANGEDFLANPLFVSYWYAIYIFVFGHLLFFRFFVPAYLFYKHRFRIEKLVEETYDTTSVYITGDKMNEFKIQAGQFLIFHFLQKGIWWEYHPFSMSKAPDGQSLRISVKSVGDFTAKIRELKPGTKVFLDGPYGVFTEKSSKKNKILFIAGGIGITPIRSLIEQMGQHGKDMVLLFGNKSSKDFVFKNELDELAQKYTLQIHHVLSNPLPEDEKFDKGYIDKDKILSLVPDALEREVFLCGPPIMMTKVVPTLIQMGIPKDLIHYEKFSLT